MANSEWRMAGGALSGVLVAAVVLAVSGCGKETPVEAVLTTEQISEDAPAVFGDAPDEIRELAESTVQAVERDDLATAWGSLHALGMRPGLSEAQREFIARSTVSVGAKLTKSAEAGDQAAREVLEFHRAHK